MMRRGDENDENDDPTVREPGNVGREVAREGWLHTESLKSVIGAGKREKSPALAGLPVSIRLTDNAEVKVLSVGTVESVRREEKPFDVIPVVSQSDHSAEQNVLVPVGYSAELRLDKMLMTLRVTPKRTYSIKVEEAGAKESLHEGFDPAVAWASACMAYNRYNMSSMSGMKAFGFLEEPVLEHMAGALAGVALEAETTYGFWENMIFSRLRGRDRGSAMGEESARTREMDHLPVSNDGRLKLLDLNSNRFKWRQETSDESAKWRSRFEPLPPPKKFRDSRPKKLRKMRSIANLLA